MKILYNAKVSAKLLGSFFILIAAMIVIGLIGLRSMNTLNQSTTSIYQDNYVPTIAISKVDTLLSDARLALQRMLNESLADEMEANMQQINDISASVSECQAIFEPSIKAPEEQVLWDAYVAAREAYIAERLVIINLLQEGNYAEATAYNINVLRPLTETFQASITALVDFNIAFAAETAQTADEHFNSSTVTTITILLVITIVAVILGILMSSIITKPLNATKMVAERIADGDLTLEIPQRYLQQKDEIGMLANNVEEMKESLIQTVSGIKGSSQIIEEQITSANQTLNTLSDRITDTSAATEELSASMEETGASAEEMNATASEIEHAVETVATKAEEGASKSGEIHARAAELETNVKASILKSDQIFSEIKVSLEKALSDSKAVDEINALADAILGITSQTTLLALNASIEAARAGEAGRGFAVVANEISALADNSKNTVTQIQAITKVVREAVNNLASSSSNLLNFVSSDVNNDYKDMLSAAASYSSDALYISDMTSDLSATSEELLASVQVIMRAITEVSMAAQDGAKTTTVVAEQTSEVSADASIIVENMKQTQSTADDLVELVNKFKLAE